MQHELTPAQAMTYVTGGHGKATLIGNANRFTYKFSASDDNKVVFVRVLTGMDNQNDYKYIGFIPIGRKHNAFGLRHGAKGAPDAPAFKALAWYMHKAASKPEVAEKVTFMHEGVCCKCGRTLTVPSSIEMGIGPKCAQNMGLV